MKADRRRSRTLSPALAAFRAWAEVSRHPFRRLRGGLLIEMQAPLGGEPTLVEVLVTANDEFCHVVAEEITDLELAAEEQSELVDLPTDPAVAAEARAQLGEIWREELLHLLGHFNGGPSMVRVGLSDEDSVRAAVTLPLAGLTLTPELIAMTVTSVIATTVSFVETLSAAVDERISEDEDEEELEQHSMRPPQTSYIH